MNQMMRIRSFTKIHTKTPITIFLPHPLLSKELIIVPLTYSNSKTYLQLVYSEALLCSLFSENYLNYILVLIASKGRITRCIHQLRNLLLVIKDPLIKRMLN